MRYSVQPNDRTFVKGYGFFSFAKNIGKNICKNISKNLSGKYSQKPLDHAKQPATDVFKTAFKRAIQKTAEATGDQFGNKIVEGSSQQLGNYYNGRNAKFSKCLQKLIQKQRSRNSERKIYVSRKKQEIINELILKQ